MTSRLAVVTCGFLLWALPAGAGAAGPWTTWLRAYTYTDLIATGDTVWCATLESGLLRLSRSSGEFELLARGPRGLASNRVSVLSFDRSGRLWVGTLGNGASVLASDRSSWTLVNEFDGLPSDSVTALEADGDTVWIGTSRGIALWNGREVSGRLPDGTNPSPFANNYVSGVAAMGDTLWIATQGGVYFGLVSSGLADWTPVNLGLRTKKIEALVTDGESLLALDSLRVYRLDPGAGQWVEAGGIGDVFRLSEDLGTIMTSSRQGIYRWNGSGWSLVNSTLRSNGQTRRNYAVTSDRLGRSVAANQDGVFVEPSSPGEWRQHFPQGPPGNNILNLALEGPRVYVTTFAEGVGRYDGRGWKYWFPVSIPVESTTTFRNSVFAFALLVDRQGRKWVGCWDSAIEAFDDHVTPPSFTHHWPVPRPVPSDDTVRTHTFAWSAALDSSGGHWLGLDTPSDAIPAIGLDYYDPGGSFVANYRPGTSPLRGGRVRAITVDRERHLWVGYAGQGIDSFDVPATPGGALVRRPISDVDNIDVQGMMAHSRDVWVFTTSDLRRYGLSGNLVSVFEIPAGPSPLGLRPLDVAADGTVWLGTANGIRVYRPDGTLQDFTTANSPLADDEVRAIQVDPVTGMVWIGTARGLSRYDPGYVPPPPPTLSRLDVTVYPNPARISAIGLGLRLSGNTEQYRGAIYDVTGRRLRTFEGVGNGFVIWDGRSGDGTPVKPGMYFVRVRAGQRSATVRVALVR